LFMPFAFAKRRSCGQKIIVWIFIKCFTQHVVNNSSYGVYSTLSTFKPLFHYPWWFTSPHSSNQSFSHQPFPPYSSIRLGAWLPILISF
jgi:hypothetical protein